MKTKILIVTLILSVAAHATLTLWPRATTTEYRLKQPRTVTEDSDEEDQDEEFAEC